MRRRKNPRNQKGPNRTGKTVAALSFHSVCGVPGLLSVPVELACFCRLSFTNGLAKRPQWRRWLGWMHVDISRRIQSLKPLFPFLEAPNFSPEGKKAAAEGRRRVAFSRYGFSPCAPPCVAKFCDCFFFLFSPTSLAEIEICRTKVGLNLSFLVVKFYGILPVCYSSRAILARNCRERQQWDRGRSAWTSCPSCRYVSS